MKIIMAVVDGGNSPLYTEMRHYWNLYRKTREPHVFVYFIRFSDDPNLFIPVNDPKASLYSLRFKKGNHFVVFFSYSFFLSFSSF
jgi:hypothetical protein